MSDTKLKPCPFCGGEAELIKRSSEHPYVHGVWCKGCHCRTSFEKSENEAIEKWNTRKPMERIVEQLKDCECDEIEGGLNIPISEAIKIVKAGGVDE